MQRPPWGRGVTLRGVQARLRVFAAEREWERFHTPRNILLALLGETGELAETVLDLPLDDGPADPFPFLLSFTSSAAAAPPTCPSRWPAPRRDALAQELADVAIYLCRFSDVCGIDLGAGLRAAATAAWQQQQAQVSRAVVHKGAGVGAALTVAGGLALVAAVALGKLLRRN